MTAPRVPVTVFRDPDGNEWTDERLDRLMQAIRDEPDVRELPAPLQAADSLFVAVDRAHRQLEQQLDSGLLLHESGEAIPSTWTDRYHEIVAELVDAIRLHGRNDA